MVNTPSIYVRGKYRGLDAGSIRSSASHPGVRKNDCGRLTGGELSATKNYLLYEVRRLVVHDTVITRSSSVAITRIVYALNSQK